MRAFDDEDAYMRAPRFAASELFILFHRQSFPVEVNTPRRTGLFPVELLC